MEHAGINGLSQGLSFWHALGFAAGGFLCVVSAAACTDRGVQVESKTGPTTSASDASNARADGAAALSDGAPGTAGASPGAPKDAGRLKPSVDAGAPVVLDAARQPLDAAPSPVKDGGLPAAHDSGTPITKKLLAVYWGQNGYGATHSDKNTWEKPLDETCAAHPEYDVLILSFATQLAHTRNQQPYLPETNFASHCETPYDSNNPFLLKCDAIGKGIGGCQAAGKKVLLSVGGATGSAGFTNDNDGVQSAQWVWNIFLGGSSTIRPFPGATLDGIDLDIEGGSGAGYVAFVRKLRALMDASAGKYYITGAPQCPYPDAFLGPGAGRALGDATSAFDYLFVQFYNNACGYGSPQAFRDSFAQWAMLATNGGPKIVVGLPATMAAAGSGYVMRNVLPSLVNDVKGNAAFAGIMLWDASNDQNSVEAGSTYGAYAKTLLP